LELDVNVEEERDINEVDAKRQAITLSTNKGLAIRGRCKGW
jgi:hypothetical protein